MKEKLRTKRKKLHEKVFFFNFTYVQIFNGIGPLIKIISKFVNGLIKKYYLYTEFAVQYTLRRS